jgi:hypothetical protein
MSTPWSISGEYLEACSCAFLCPCIPSNASAPATEDFCKFAMTYRIDAGRFGTTDLAGVAFAIVAESKRIMAEGGWVMGVIVDARATPDQADAVGQITSGRAGGPMAAFAPLIGEFRGIERHPIQVEITGNRRAATIPGILEDAVEGVPSVAVPGECLAIDNVFHPAAKRLSLATALRHVISCFGITWNDSSNRRNGHFASFSWSGAT